MKYTLPTFIVIAVVTLSILGYNALNSDTVIDASDAGRFHFESLGDEWVQEDFAVTISELKIVIAAAEYRGWDYVPTTAAYNTETGKMKVGYKPFDPLNTTFELFPPPCEPFPCVEITQR